ncbi:hypothetical protein SORBI_3001G457466 [Sorghum bicolor]|uniref:Uncharacterized protein n=1 Tax=Sorghum bicolor TaxID=4558 RepID=A0A1Z5SAR3_SORBI|nr:hypothetical protein SORBI_3001G457466 [Sorghum bicolor]
MKCFVFLAVVCSGTKLGCHGFYLIVSGVAEMLSCNGEVLTHLTDMLLITLQCAILFLMPRSFYVSQLDA